MNPEDVRSIIESLAGLAQEVYGWAFERVVMEAQFDLIFSVVFGVASIVGIALTVNPKKYSRGGWFFENDCEPLGWVAAVVCLVLLPICVYAIGHDIVILQTPEWSALELILAAAAGQ